MKLFHGIPLFDPRLNIFNLEKTQKGDYIKMGIPGVSSEGVPRISSEGIPSVSSEGIPGVSSEETYLEQTYKSSSSSSTTDDGTLKVILIIFDSEKYIYPFSILQLFQVQ